MGRGKRDGFGLTLVEFMSIMPVIIKWTQESSMPVYFAGTGETADLETILIGLAVFFAVVAFLSWGIPFMGNTIRRWREARLHRAEQAQALDGMPDQVDDLEMRSMQTH